MTSWYSKYARSNASRASRSGRSRSNDCKALSTCGARVTSAATKPPAVATGCGLGAGRIAARLLRIRPCSTALSSFCRVTGFSKNASAPILVASTAVSMVAWPLIMITGMVRAPVEAHSLSSVTPSVSGIQMSSKTRSGRSRKRAARACAAFSASSTVWPSSLRISHSKSRMPCSSSTTKMFAMIYARSGKASVGWGVVSALANDSETWAPKTFPSCTRLLISMREAWSSAIFFTTASPKPVPRCLVVT